MTTRWLLVVPGLAALVACSFPDVDYADGGGAASGTTATSSGSTTSQATTASSAGGCAGLAGCTAAASSCASAAQGQYDQCAAACKNPGCVNGCDKTQSNSQAACATTCVACATTACAGAATACDTAAGL